MLYENMPWRTGSKNGRVIYVDLGHPEHKDEPMIGAMDTRELAARVVQLHNADLRIGSVTRSELMGRIPRGR